MGTPSSHTNVSVLTNASKYAMKFSSVIAASALALAANAASLPTHANILVADVDVDARSCGTVLKKLWNGAPRTDMESARTACGGNEQSACDSAVKTDEDSLKKFTDEVCSQLDCADPAIDNLAHKYTDAWVQNLEMLIQSKGRYPGPCSNIETKKDPRCDQAFIYYIGEFNHQVEIAARKCK